MAHAYAVVQRTGQKTVQEAPSQATLSQAALCQASTDLNLRLNHFLG